MRKLLLAAASLAAFAAAPAFAQDETTTTTEATAPDGTPAFGIEPYVAVMGGWEGFDNNRSTNSVVPYRPRRLQGGLVQGVAGINVPLGPVFVGAEGVVAKGFTGQIDWEYGVMGRIGPRIGDSGMIYAKAGYMWVNFDKGRNLSRRDVHDWSWGGGVEVGPKDIGLGGITGNAGVRLRAEVTTFGNADSIRPMAGVVLHF